ncbi:putative beta-galactosidase [Microlunatus phosphovorus NM-1]|uniref:beta-glucosidase n=1 Tax=Microlunatus phosphovorus (strain ATCC 700054 / DSM 10555 / JCM 9379 / NBRC 101784 / NCIMB 13414 / VKM Ac-1990 / NM-1) TaxID=1032480 RepID=F5XGJ5_MICPN|nr:family 1 glycosylhydrolase [Microlunatus phosphovorus]BAK33102.1 putative beta-galactosidase [Microlunatus phosphovorus NM-1]
MTQLRDDFIWGAATAAHQIEGGNTNSDFWVLEQGGSGRFAEPSGDACDSYHRYPDDIRLLAEAGLKAYRFSIEWARIEPAQGQFSRAQLLHYRAMIDECQRHGVLPIITLHHFTYPRWFTENGGLHRDDAVERFAAYVDYVSQILHDIDWVVTINEPNIAALFAGLYAAPSEGSEPVTVAMALADGPDAELVPILAAMHHAARDVLRAKTSAKIGWAPATQAFMPTEGNEAKWQEVFDAWEGVFFDATEGDDFIGIQSYTSQPVDANGPVPHPPHPDNTLTGWAYRPDALAINLRRVWDLKGLPLLVTENGIATDDDERRIAYVTGALSGLKGAVADGVEVLGYCYWSLLDNYEWGSYGPTFGLIAVDRGGDFDRTPKPSLAWLGTVAASNGALID